MAFDLAERRRARHLLDRLVLAEGMAVAPADCPARSGDRAFGTATSRSAIPDDSTVIVEFVRGGA